LAAGAVTATAEIARADLTAAVQLGPSSCWGGGPTFCRALAPIAGVDPLIDDLNLTLLAGHARQLTARADGRIVS
jgi:hypothetical protein